MTNEAIQLMLKDLIQWYGIQIEREWLPNTMSGIQLLGAIAENESSFGVNRVSKHEVSWDQGGKYFQKDLWTRWGSDASCSRSSFQLMYPIAVMEYGLSPELSPMLLDEDHICIFYVAKYLKRKWTQGADTVEKMLDAYNSGTHKDVQSDKVKEYITKGTNAYFNVRTKYGLTGGRIILKT